MSDVAPSGLGIFIWQWSQCEQGNIDTIISKAKRCGITWVAIQVDSAAAALHCSEALVYDRLHQAGLYVAEWKYCVPGQTETADYILWARRCIGFGADAILPDCEIEWESRDGKPADRRPEALVFAQALRNALGPDCFIGNCGAWQWPDAHPVYPDHAFGNYWSAGLPERYWTMFSPSHSPSSVLDESDRQWADPENVNAYKTLIPIGSAFDGTAQGGQICQPDDVSDFLDRQPTCALWSWQHISPALWAMLEARAASVVSTLPPPAI